MRVFLLVLAVGAATVAAAPKVLPAAWPVCKKADPNIGDCISKAVAAAVEDLSTKGAKEFGIFPIDPLLISHVQIGQGKGPVSIDLQFSDLNIHGLRSAKVGKVNADVDKFQFTAPIVIKDPIVLKGKYKINGRVLVLPINGEGDCDLVLTNVTAKLELTGKEMKKDNQKYMDVVGFKFVFDTTGMKIKLENLFNGNKELSDNMNKFLNENWPVILNELKPGIQDAFGAAFGDISNRIFHKVPYNKIFP